MSDNTSLQEHLVGVWSLVDARTIAVDSGATRSAYGDGATGFIQYTSDGRMMALITHAGRTRMSGSDRQSAPDHEKVAAYTTSIAYAGRYSMEGGKVLHHVEASSYENWVGTDLVRLLELRGDNVVLKTVPQPQAGILSVVELEWKRCE